MNIPFSVLVIGAGASILWVDIAIYYIRNIFIYFGYTDKEG